ncbi:MAG: energy-coupling factor ABC transporter permease [Actinomycetia bacterium]|nr:energy-coupling factor ABC transporter permease [Actinomycetes bacterium]
MHIPDGMLDTKTWVSTWVGSAGALAYAVSRVRRELKDNKIVLMAVLAALVFALQMLNFPVAGGTSGHFAGGAAVAIILGPWPAVVVMAAVLVVQALLFADGGITALGANMIDMAIVGPLVGWLVYRAFRSVAASARIRPVAAFAAGWIACVAGALCAALLLWISGRVPLAAGLAAMGFWHVLIGLGEGAITAGLVTYLASVRPDLLADEVSQGIKPARDVAVSLGVLAVVAAGFSFLASARPDGLEFVYEQVGRPFQGGHAVPSPMAGYAVPFVTNSTVAGVLAGIVGVIVTGTLAYVIVRAVRARTRLEKSRG